MNYTLKIRFLKAIPAFALMGIWCAIFTSNVSGSALHQASVTESFNTVSYQTSSDAPQQAATTGTVIHPANIVRTGVDSRAELQFNDNTITRMGANSVFSFDEKTQAMNLQQGSVLFSKPKNNDTFEITTPAATCSISGTTGFAQFLGNSLKSLNHKGTLLFGLIEGKTTVTIDGKGYPISSGELLISTGGLVRIVDFNLQSFLDKAGLVKKFKSKLPNSLDIQKAVEHFASLSKRGFVEPTGFAFALNSNQLTLVENLITGGQNGQSLTQLGNQVQSSQVMQAQSMGMGSSGSFVNVGGVGAIHGQLVWNVDVDLDLHLILPGAAGNVGFNNRTVTFNSGAATAQLDVDDTGAVNGPGTTRVENIYVTGTPASGTYQFYGQYYGNSGGVTSPVAYTLTVTGNGGATTQTISGTLSTPGGLSGQTTPYATVIH